MIINCVDPQTQSMVIGTAWVQNFVGLKICIFAETFLLLNFQRF